MTSSYPAGARAFSTGSGKVKFKGSVGRIDICDAGLDCRHLALSPCDVGGAPKLYKLTVTGVWTAGDTDCDCANWNGVFILQQLTTFTVPKGSTSLKFCEWGRLVLTQICGTTGSDLLAHVMLDETTGNKLLATAEMYSFNNPVVCGGVRRWDYGGTTSAPSTVTTPVDCRDLGPLTLAWSTLSVATTKCCTASTGSSVTFSKL